MKMKAVNEIKAIAPNRKKISQKAYIAEDTLVIDQFEKGNHVLRGCIDKKGKSAIAEIKNGEEKWHSASMFENYCCYSYSNNYIGRLADPEKEGDMSADDIELCRGFLEDVFKTKGIYTTHVTALATSLASEYSYEIRENTRKNHNARVDAKMAEIEEIPEQELDRLLKKYFPNEYLIKYDDDTYYCTACNCYHFKPAKIKWPDGKTVTCENGKNVIVKKRTRSWAKSIGVFFATRHNDNIVFRDAVLKVWYDAHTGKRTLFTELIRAIYNQGVCQKVYFYQGDVDGYVNRDNLWNERNAWNTRTRKQAISLYGLAEAECDSSCVRALERAGVQSYNWFGILNGGHPEYEYLIDCPRLLDECLNKWNFRVTFKADAKTIWDALEVDKQRYLRLKQANGGCVYLRWLQYEKEKGKKIPEEVIAWYERVEISPLYAERFLKIMSAEAIKNYIIREIERADRKVNKGEVYHFLDQWGDYLNMAKKLGHDPDKEIIYRCKNLYKRHDEAVEELQRIQAEKDAAEKERLYGGFNAVAQDIKDKYSWDDGKSDYVFIMPSGMGDIEIEGRTLHHCINTSDRYYEREIARESYLGFVRRREELTKPYYTIEFEPDGSIRQMRSEYNNQPIKTEISAFLKKWQKAIKGRLTEEDYQLSGESRILMQKNLEALRNTGNERDAKFADLLEGDYEANEDGILWQMAI